MGSRKPWVCPAAKRNLVHSRVKSGLSAFIPLDYRCYCFTVGVTPGRNPSGSSGLEKLGHWFTNKVVRFTNPQSAQLSYRGSLCIASYAIK